MSRSSPISPLLSRVLARLHAGLKRADRAVFAAEVLNGGADLRRGPEVWDQLRSEAEVCFVLSTGRTATATLAALLGASPGVDAHHEPEPRLVAASYLAWEGHGTPQFWADAVGLARDRAVFAAHRKGKVYFETSHRLALLAPALAARYRRARFVLAWRPADEFIASGVRRGFYAGHPWDHARPRPREGDPAENEWLGWSAERRCGWLWKALNDRALEFVAGLDPDRLHTLRSADLIGGSPAVIESLFRFVGVPPLPPRTVQRVLAQRHNRQVGLYPWGREPTWSAQERAAILAELAGTTERLVRA